MHNLKKLKKEKFRLIRNINKIAKQRKTTINKVSKLNKLFSNSKISYKKYDSSLKKLLNKKSFTYWINNNSRHLDSLQKHLYTVNARINGSDRVYIEKNVILVLLTILFVITFFTLDLTITGLSVLDAELVLESNNTISIGKNISSLRLSGSLEGDGSAKIYLDNYLVMDTELLNLSQSSISSQTEENLENKASDAFSIQPVIEKNTYEFSEICLETCDSLEIINSSLIVEIKGSLIVKISDFNYTTIIQQPGFSLEETKSQITENNSVEDFNEELIQVKAELNKPVEWKLVTRNKTIELPIESANILVEKIVNESDGLKEQAKLKNRFGIASLSKVIEIDELNETKIEVSYKTKAPYSIESNLTELPDLKVIDITIKSDSELHYKNILSFTEIPESEKDQIHLYHFINNSKTEITNNYLYNVTFEDVNSNNLIDKLYWITQELSEQNFSVEISLLILNIQSYPEIGGNWTVEFTTTGTANLTISAFNGTFWSNINENYDLKFLEVKCGNEIKNYEWIDNSVFIQNYQCNETARETSKVLTRGKHSLQFTFGNITKYAYNLATGLNTTLVAPANASTATSLNSQIVNITAEVGTSPIAKLILFVGNSSNLDLNNVLLINFSVLSSTINNISINVSALPIKPNGTDSVVLLYHLDNASSPLNSSTYENDTHVLDYSRTSALNNGTYVRWNSSQYAFTNQSGRFGLSAVFNGINNFITVQNSSAYPTSLQITQNITLAAWFKLDYNFTNYSATYSNISSQTIIDNGDYALYFDYAKGSLNFKLNNASNSNWTQVRNGTGGFARYDKLQSHN